MRTLRFAHPTRPFLFHKILRAFLMGRAHQSALRDGREGAAMPGTIIRSARLLDTDAGTLRPGTSLRVEGDRIVEVADAGAARAATPCRRIDAGGRVVLPGLIDAHVHAASPLDLAAMVRQPLSRVTVETTFILDGMLRRGFTTVRDAGGTDAGW